MREGFIFGAKGGNGLLIIRRGNNKFSGPFFFDWRSKCWVTSWC